MSNASPHRLRSAALTAALVLAAPAPLAAASFISGDQAAPQADILKPLPASRDELTFRGESSSASWPVFFSRTEAARTAILQLNLLNTVSLLPERSSLRVTVNGRVLATTPIHSPEKAATIPVRIPPGVLVPGFNAVKISVVMSHRVDCSIKATYELWTLLDPARTGFLVPAQAAFSARTLDDLPAESPSEAGTTRIHLRAAADANGETLSRAAALVTALVARSHLSRPVVDVGPDAGSGPGFDVVLDADGSNAQAKVVGKQDGVVFSRMDSNRLVLSPESDLDATIAALRGSAGQSTLPGTAEGVRAANAASGTVVDGEQRLSFAELGVRTDGTAGRRYLNVLGVTLPGDFYAGSYGRAQIFLDATRAAGLTDQASLVFRVNGTLVSTLPLGLTSPETLNHALVDLPLQFFRPGYNEIELEGMLATAADDQCEPGSLGNSPRLTVADTSELSIPHIARLQTAPQIAPLLRFDEAKDPAAAELYFASADAASLGAGLTIVANMAAADHLAGPVHVNLDQPSRADRPGIVIGVLGDLPDAFAGSIRSLTAEPEVKADADTSMPATAVANAAPPRGLGGRLATAVGIGKTWLRNRGFFFAGLSETADKLPMNDHSVVMAAVRTNDHARSIAGLPLPTFIGKSDSWLVVSGRSTSALVEGTAALVAGNHWKNLTGEAASFDVSGNHVETRKATTLAYVLPERIALGDVRPILGGIVSSNVLLSSAGLLTLLVLLGLSTTLFLRIGRKTSN